MSLSVAIGVLERVVTHLVNNPSIRISDADMERFQAEALAALQQKYRALGSLRNRQVLQWIDLSNDVDRREQEHQGEWPDGHITPVGRRTTRDAALQWERDGGTS